MKKNNQAGILLLSTLHVDTCKTRCRFFCFSIVLSDLSDRHRPFQSPSYPRPHVIASGSSEPFP
ncbi:unnamed protein product [Nesidiocoris tenuis]|uniref:Uncharacterized protein n=1 Tax=Nesidiocoris tenuis TaxID=355587 RepID=A0A6H5HJM5_9HEMI|nr:unnamed protein product [Nesidiocoris tenuis]